MNKIYEIYIQMLSEMGYLELEEFVDFLKSEINRFFDIIYENILEGIRTKSETYHLSDEEIEEMAKREYERLLELKRRLFYV